MAYIVDYAVTIYTAATASMVMQMPAHQAGDLLVACLNKDTNSAFTTPAGWYAATTVLSTGAANGIYTKRAASSSETVTFTLTSETCIGVVIAIRGQYWDGSTTNGSDAIDQAVSTGADDSSLPFTGASVTTTQNNELVIHMVGGDAVYGLFCLPGIVQLFGGDTGANSIAVGYTFQKTAGACYTPTVFSGSAADDTRGLSVSIKDDTNNTAVSPYVGNATAGATLLGVLNNNVSGVNLGSLKTAAPLDITTVGAKTLTYIAYTTNTADVGYNPFHGVVRFNATSSTSTLYGQELTFTSAVDMTAGAGVIFGMWQFTSPRDYLDVGLSNTGGVLIGIADADNDYKFWCIGGQLSKTTSPWNMQNFAVQVNGTSDTTYAASGTLAYNAINDIYWAAQAYFGATQLDFSQLWLLNQTQILGGTSGVPLEFLDIERAANYGTGGIPIFQRTGSAAVLWSRFQFGGADASHFLVDLRTFQYPRKADEANYLDFHVDNNHLGIEFYGLSGDTIKFTNCVFTSESSYYWRFNSSHNAGATLDFSGTTVVNATVTLRSTVGLTSVNFISCPTFTLNSAVLTDCRFKSTKVSADSPADAADIIRGTFISGGTGHAIEIGGSAADFSLNGCQFSGYAASNGSTGNEAIYINIASGSMTISITGGGSTPSIRTAGATVTVVNARNLTLSPIVSGSDVVIYAAGTTTVIESSQDIAGTSYVYDYPASEAGNLIDIGVFKAGYVPFYIRAYTKSNADASVPISQVVDRFYIA
jgi:hypothetical protein